MILARGYQALLARPASRVPIRNLFMEPVSSAAAGNDEPDRGDAAGRAEALRTEAICKALKASLSMLTFENQSLQSTLEAQRMLCEELRLALESQRRAAITDPLSGLYNRRAMDQQLDALWAAQNPAPLSILLLDIDHFKRINDTYGHPGGDRVIHQVAETLRRSLRAEDSAFRYGGEEFMVLLPNIPLEGAIRVAEAIRARIEGLHTAHREEGLAACTVSLGVASRRESEDCASLFLRVDRALYQAKQQGRNRVVYEVALHS